MLDAAIRACRTRQSWSDDKAAIALEKAKTYIDTAIASRSAKERDELFVSAQDQLKEFLKLSDHPRLSEARLLLGKLQMVRGGQLLGGAKATDESRAAARASYLEAAKTVAEIADDQVFAKLDWLLEQPAQTP